MERFRAGGIAEQWPASEGNKWVWCVEKWDCTWCIAMMDYTAVVCVTSVTKILASDMLKQRMYMAGNVTHLKESPEESYGTSNSDCVHSMMDVTPGLI